jgi:hypothetical protein
MRHVTSKLVCYVLLSYTRYTALYFRGCIIICAEEYNGPPLWSSGQSSWLQVRRPEFDSRHYKKKVGLERGPLSLVSTIEELLDRKVAASV